VARQITSGASRAFSNNPAGPHKLVPRPGRAIKGNRCVAPVSEVMPSYGARHSSQMPHPSSSMAEALHGRQQQRQARRSSRSARGSGGRISIKSSGQVVSVRSSISGSNRGSTSDGEHPRKRKIGTLGDLTFWQRHPRRSSRTRGCRRYIRRQFFTFSRSRHVG
jgi:hypothetical protein